MPNDGIVIPDTFNIVSVLLDDKIEKGLGEKTVLYYRDETLSYAQLLERSNRAGNALRTLGIEMENRVVLLLLDCPEFFYVKLGLMKIGAVPVPVSTMMRSKDYEYILNDSRAKGLVVSQELLAIIEPIKNRLKYLKHIVVVGDGGNGYRTLKELMTDAAPQLHTVETSKDDVAFWLYSSGTTGFPKGIVHLHHDMVYAAESSYKQGINGDEDDIIYSMARLFFGLGNGMAFFFMLYTGGSAVLVPERPVPEVILQTIHKYRPTVICGAPTLYEGILQTLKIGHAYDLSTLRVCMSGGEPLTQSLYDRWLNKVGTELVDCFGCSEANSTIIQSPLGRPKIGSCGASLPGFEIRLVDDEGNDVPRGQVGYLLVNGDSITPGYWNRHDINKQTFLGEWFKTGDMLYRDEEGYFWYVGRGDDMFKARGIWVSPVEVEKSLSGHPAVADCGVIAAPDEAGLMKTLAFVVTSTGHEPDEKLAEELRNHVKSQMASYKVPKWVRFISEIPRTPSGKIQRFRLRETMETEDCSHLK